MADAVQVSVGTNPVTVMKKTLLWSASSESTVVRIGMANDRLLIVLVNDVDKWQIRT